MRAVCVDVVGVIAPQVPTHLTTFTQTAFLRLDVAQTAKVKRSSKND